MKAGKLFLWNYHLTVCSDEIEAACFPKRFMMAIVSRNFGICEFQLCTQLPLLFVNTNIHL